MVDAAAPAGDERELVLRYAARCRLCDVALPSRSRAVWDRATKTARCLACALPSQPGPPHIELDRPPAAVDFGIAGASAQRLFDAKEARRRERLRRNWWVLAVMGAFGAVAGGLLAHQLQMNILLLGAIGAAIPVLDLVRRPQHIDAWRSGAAGERAVGKTLDSLRVKGVVSLHDRRVPRRRTNIDHIAVAPTGVFVIDTKNHVGKVTASRSGLRVAGRRQDKMLDGVASQLAVVQEVLDVPSATVVARGVLCFTKADLPWLRPRPRGIALLYPRGLRKTLTKGDAVLTREQVNTIATLLATRLPPA